MKQRDKFTRAPGMSIVPSSGERNRIFGYIAIRETERPGWAEAGKRARGREGSVVDFQIPENSIKRVSRVSFQIFFAAEKKINRTLLLRICSYRV